jgi:hypothetical protein
MNHLEWQNKVDALGIPYYKAISVFLKTRDEYIAENNLEKGNKTMNEFLKEIYPEHFDKIFTKFLTYIIYN